MNPYFGLNWISYFCTGLVMLVVSSLLSGCRLGNQQVSAPQTDDGVTGNYEMTPVSLKYCSSDVPCKSLPLDQIPSELSSVFTNPVRIQLTDPAQGKIFFFDPLGKGQALGIFETNMVIEGEGGRVFNTAWLDPLCSEVDQIHVTGAIVRSTATPPKEVSGLSISGRVSLTYRSSISFQGTTCSATIDAMVACYNSAKNCGGGSAVRNGQLQGTVHTEFDAYIDAGVIPLGADGTLHDTDVHSLTNLAWELTYE